MALIHHFTETQPFILMQRYLIKRFVRLIFSYISFIEDTFKEAICFPLVNTSAEMTKGKEP